METLNQLLNPVILKKYYGVKLILILAITMAIFLLGVEILNFEKIAWGAKIAGIKVGGLNLKQAERLLNLSNLSETKLKFYYQNINKEVSAKDLGIIFNSDFSLKESFTLGRNKNPILGLKEKVLALTGKYNLPLYFSFNLGQLDQWLKINFPIEQPAQNATPIFNPLADKFEVTSSAEGIVINREKLKEDISKNVAFLNLKPIEIQLIKDYPQIKKEQALSTQTKANQILENTPYFLKYSDYYSEIEKEELISWIEFKPSQILLDKTLEGKPRSKILEIKFNKEKIENYLIKISPVINREPINAQLTVENGKVTAFALSQPGIRLRVEKTAEILAKNITDGKKETEILVKETEPEITIENIENLGITSLLGKGQSNFWGSSKNRIHNIKIGSVKFHGTLIKPGEEFSFNKTLGPIGPNQGYLPEQVIKKDKIVPEYGGGLCQVSTTFFRAAIKSGLKITERYPHAFPVRYYDPQGFDATVYSPHPDLRFINDTPNNVLIQTKIEGYNLIFEIYGTDDGRKVEIVGPIILEKKEDGSMKTKLTQNIYKNEELWRQDIFYSSYKSPALYPVEKNPLE